MAHHGVALAPVHHKGAARGKDTKLSLVVGKEANTTVAAVAVGAHFGLVPLGVEAAFKDAMGKGTSIAILALSCLPEALTGLARIVVGLGITPSHFFAGV